MTAQMLQLEQMVNASANHPSIFVWGFWNEGPSDDKDACPGYNKNVEKLQALDSTRFVTWASNKKKDDQCLNDATLIAWNSYPGWYDTSDPTEFWNDLADWTADKFPDKPVVISETGAGGIYEYDNVTAIKWSLQYQSQVLLADVTVFLMNQNLSGLTLWHFFDFKGNDDATEYGPCDYLPDIDPPVCGYIDISDHRPGGENHKGVVDFWRRPKPSYYIVMALYYAVPTYPSALMEDTVSGITLHFPDPASRHFHTIGQVLD